MTKQILTAIQSAAACGIVFSGLFAGAAQINVNRLKDVETRGKVIVAKVDGGTVGKGKRNSGTKLNLSWTEPRQALPAGFGDLASSNAPGISRDARALPISSAFAEKIIRDNTLMIDTITIKAVPGEPNIKPIILDDTDISIAGNLENRNFFGIGALLCGLLWSGLALAGRRRQTTGAP